MTAEQRGQAIRIVAEMVNRQREEPTSCGGGRQPSLNSTSRMSREAHVRFCERLVVRFHRPTRRNAAVEQRTPDSPSAPLRGEPGVRDRLPFGHCSTAALYVGRYM